MLQKALKSFFGRGSVPDLAGEANDAPLDPLVGWGGHLVLSAFGASVSPLSASSALDLDAYGFSFSAFSAAAFRPQ